MRWELRIRKSVKKRILNFPKRDQKQILASFKEISLSPYFGDVNKIRGEKNVWRRRTGAYRIFYEIYTDGKFIVVFRIERRTSKTY